MSRTFRLLDYPAALPRAGDARAPSLGQRLIRLFPRRTLFHRLRTPSGVGLYRPAAADAADRRRVGRCVSLAAGASGSFPRSRRRRPSRSRRRRLGCWAAASTPAGSPASSSSPAARCRFGASSSRPTLCSRWRGSPCGICIINAEQDDEPRWWLAAGAIGGIAFLAKYTVALYLGLSRARPPRHARSAACSRAGSRGRPSSSRRRSRRPNLVWQAANGWPFVAHTAVLAAEKNIPFSLFSFFVQEILALGPASAPVWLAGLAAFAFWPRFAAYRVGSP